MKYGYLRVSTKDQSNDKFYKALEEAGVCPEMITEETISGAKSWRRRALGELIESLSPGDEIIVPELSRLGRGAADVLDLRDELLSREITCHTLKEGYRIGAGMRAADKMVITIMAAVNEMERDYISERTLEGLAHAKAKGRKLGGYRRRGFPVSESKPRDSHPDKENALKSLRSGGNISEIARQWGVSRTTLYRWRREEKAAQVSTAQA